MDIHEYKKKYTDESSPWWDSIEAKLKKIYWDSTPHHWWTIMPYSLWWPDPLPWISAYKSSSWWINHHHFCTYWFSSLYYDTESVGKESSQYGFEITFRLKDSWESEKELVWVCNFIQNIAKYVFQTGNCFNKFHWLPANWPIKSDSDTKITWVIFILDQELGEMDTPHGKVMFLQMIGITDPDIEQLKDDKISCEQLYEQVSKKNPLWVTDLNYIKAKRWGLF